VEFVGALALAVLVRLADAERDVGRLRADRHLHAAGRAVEALGRGVVADLQDLFPDDLGYVDVAVGGDLAGHVYLSGSDQGLYCARVARVSLEHPVQDRVTDLIGHLVRWPSVTDSEVKRRRAT